MGSSPAPPPLLTFDQARHLASQGWLPFDIPLDFRKELDNLSASTTSFFNLVHDEKRALYPASRGTECGFYHVRDEKEYVTFRSWVHRQSELEEHVRAVWSRAGQLLYRILCDLCSAGYYDSSVWDDIVAGALELPSEDMDMDRNITLMRLFRYYPGRGFAAEHVDIGLLTLCVGGGKGLQVLDRLQNPPQWIDADGPVILVGDMVRALFRNRVRAGAHRVVENPDGRESIVFALRPCLKGNIDLSQFGGEGIVDAKDYFYQIKASKYNINATKAIRERQQKAQNERRVRTEEVESTESPHGQG